MNRHSLPLIGVFLIYAAFVASAQPGTRSCNMGDALSMRLLNSRPKKQYQSAARGTAGHEQLLGFTTEFRVSPDSMRLADSCRYYYGTSTHPSYLDNEDLYSYMETTTSILSVWTNPYLRIIRHPMVGFDSAYQTISNFGATANTTNLITRTYDANLLAHEENEIYNYDVIRPVHGVDVTDFDYNADSQLVFITHLPYDPAFYDGAGASFKTYSGEYLVKDSLIFPPNSGQSTMRVIDYAYDPSGNLTSVIDHWFMYGYNGEIESRDAYAYSSDNLLVAHSVERHPTTAINLPLFISELDSFFYTGSDVTKRTSYSRYLPTDTLQTQGSAYYYYHRDNAGNIDSMVSSTLSPSGPVPFGKVIYSYTAENHYREILEYNSGGATNSKPDTRRRFYYSSDIPAKINTVANRTGNAIVYPNPSGNQLFIRFKTPPAGNVSGKIYNTLGQMVKSAVLEGKLTELSVESLPAGSYFLKLESGVSLEQYPFVKK